MPYTYWLWQLNLAVLGVSVTVKILRVQSTPGEGARQTVDASDGGALALGSRDSGVWDSIPQL